MELNQLITKAINIKNLYAEKNQLNGHNQWSAAEYLQGFIGDVGDVTKLVMAKNNFRHKDNIDEKIAHELADCLWSVMVIAHELNVDLEKEFISTMDGLQDKLNTQQPQ